MTPHFAHLSSLRPYRHCTVLTADGSPLSIFGQGTLCSDSFHVLDVSLVSDLTMQFMSAGQITNHDCRLIIDPNFCYIQDRRTCPRRHDSRLWELDWLHLPSAVPASLVSSAFAASPTSLFSQWHHRLGHPCGSQLSSLLHRGLSRSVSGRVFRLLSELSIGK
jgi:hypothetical protein